MTLALGDVLPVKPTLLIEGSLGGVGPQTVGNAQWLAQGPDNALTDLSIRVGSFEAELLNIEYLVHLSGIGDRDRWYQNGEHVNDDPRHQILAVRARLRGHFAHFYELSYDARHTVAQLLSSYSNGENCGILGMSRSDAGGGPAWLYGVRFSLQRKF